MSKVILFFTSALILTGCSNQGTEVQEEPYEIPDSEVSTISDVELEETDQTEEEIEEISEVEEVETPEPKEPWDVYDDPNEVVAISNEEELYTIADAPLLENEVEEAFAEPIEGNAAMTTSKWSAFVHTFTLQMDDQFSDEYINAMKELNDSITSNGYAGDVEKVKEMVQEARTIREAE